MADSGKPGLMRAATYASVGAAVVLIVVKLAAWLLTDAISLLSTLLDSLMDSAASLVNLFAVRFALRPADRDHRFGHGKAEPLAGLMQAAFIAGSALFLLFQAAERLFHPQLPQHGTVGVGVMLFSIAVTVALVLFQRHVIRRTGSVAIRADSLHYEGDVLINLGVIASLLLGARFGWSFVDPLFGLAVALYLFHTARGIARDALHLVMDRELPEAARHRILALAVDHPEVCMAHDLRTRSSGSGEFIQLHLELDPELPLREAHRIADEVMYLIRAEFPRAEVLIHQDPAGVREERARFSDD